jgi:hypothetical protein
MSRKRDPKTERIRRMVRIAGEHYAKLIRDFERDPELGPKIAAAADRHIRGTVRLQLLETMPCAWDLLDESRWPSRRKPHA